MVIICLGDSLTKGFRIPRKKVWTELAAAQTGHRLVNCGVVGDTTGGMLSRFRRDVLDRRPQMVLLMGGGNDILAGCPRGVPQSNIMSMVHQAYAHKIVPMLGLPIPSDPASLRADWRTFAAQGIDGVEMQAYREWLQNFAETFRIPVVDFYRPFADLPQLADYLLDGVHPAENGHRLMAEIFCRALNGDCT